MNAFRLLAPAALFAVAIPALSCSSKTAPPTSGGAHFEFQAPAGVSASKCPDITTSSKTTLAVTGSDGKLKLIADGADGANVSCQVDDSHTHFKVSVGNDSGSMSASGVISGTTSTAASMSFFIHASSAQYESSPKGCTINFTVNDGNKLFGKFLCDEVDHQTLAGSQCAVTGRGADGTSLSFFSFSDCTAL